MTTEPKDVWDSAYNDTDYTLSQIEGLAIALDGLVDDHFCTSDMQSRALVTLVKTMREKLERAFELRSAEFAAGRAAFGAVDGGGQTA